MISFILEPLQKTDLPYAIPKDQEKKAFFFSNVEVKGESP